LSSKMKAGSVTTHRQLLLDILREAKSHVDAKQLFQEAVKRDHRISLATVYRSLRLFKELGLVNEMLLDKTRCSYEIRKSGEHFHAICRGCGKVTEFKSPIVHQLVEEVQRKSGMTVIRAALNVEGYCTKCNDKKKSY
jgi:Fur family ferric uptake transcriptional regulator